MGPTRRKRRILRRAFAAAAALLLLAVLAVVVDGWRAMGRRARGARRERIERSPQFRGGTFHNPQPLWNDTWGMLTGVFRRSAHGSPAATIPTVPVDPRRLALPPATGLRVTWLGHAAILLEIDGYRVLTDPTWSDRASPVGWVGPRRWFAPPLPLADLPPVDAVVISHDHYDHLDHRTIVALRDRDLTFFVPLGVGAHLEYWGVPGSRIVELDWWERGRVRDLEVVCTPARHASGRTPFDNDTTLWAGWALLGTRHRAYFSGDTGLFPAMEEIGARLGPFDVTMIETGQYNRAWPDWHIGPEQAVVAHRMVRGRIMLPVHWGLFTLAFHGWTEPVERVLAAAAAQGVPVVAPRPGQTVEPDAPPPRDRWWPDVPWETAAESPIRSTRVVAE